MHKEHLKTDHTDCCASNHATAASCVSSASCSCCHEEEEKSEKREKLQFVFLMTAIGLFVIAFLLEHFSSAKLLSAIFMVTAWLLAGYEVIISAVKKLFSGFLLDEQFLMTVATVGAVALRAYPEAAMVMILYQIGELLEDYAVGKSENSIADLLDIAAPYANLITEDGVKKIQTTEIMAGNILEVKPGELVPADGIVISGHSSLNTAAITGEALPLEVLEGDKVISGSLNGDGLLQIKAETAYQESTVSRVMAMVEEASTRKARAESLVTRFSRIYTPVVVVLAVLLSVIPPLLFADQSFSTWIYRGLTFLVVSCPCAFVISVPLTFVSGLGMASRNGVLIRGGNDLETLSKLKTLAFDKTGTLTEGEFTVIASHAEKDVNPDKFITLAATMEQSFTHPIAQSIVKYARSQGLSLSSEGLSEVTSLLGHGVRGVIDKDNGLELSIRLPATVYLGNAALMKTLGLHEEAHADGCEGQAWSMSHVAIIPGLVDKRSYDELNQDLTEHKIHYLGHIVIRDRIKAEAKDTIAALRAEGVERIALLTGDNEVFAREVAHETGITEVHASLLPQDKAAWMQKTKEEEKSGSCGFAGDGINDAPVLMTADVGIAMGGLGSDAAIEAADVVLMQDDLSALLKGLIISRKTMRIARQNITFALGIKFIFLLLASLGLTSMPMAVFADVGVTLLVILNCFRVFRIPHLHKFSLQRQRLVSD